MQRGAAEQRRTTLGHTGAGGSPRPCSLWRDAPSRPGVWGRHREIAPDACQLDGFCLSYCSGGGTAGRLSCIDTAGRLGSGQRGGSDGSHQEGLAGGPRWADAHQSWARKAGPRLSRAWSRSESWSGVGLPSLPWARVPLPVLPTPGKRPRDWFCRDPELLAAGHCPSTATGTPRRVSCPPPGARSITSAPADCRRPTWPPERAPPEPNAFAMSSLREGVTKLPGTAGRPAPRPPAANPAAAGLLMLCSRPRTFQLLLLDVAEMFKRTLAPGIRPSGGDTHPSLAAQGLDSPTPFP